MLHLCSICLFHYISKDKVLTIRYCSVWHLLNLSALNVSTKLWLTFQATSCYVMSLNNIQKYILHILHQRGWGWAWVRLITCFCCLCQRQYLWLIFPDSRNRKTWFPIHFCLHLVLFPLDSMLHWLLLTIRQHLIHKSLPSHWLSNTALIL